MLQWNYYFVIVVSCSANTGPFWASLVLWVLFHCIIWYHLLASGYHWMNRSANPSDHQKVSLGDSGSMVEIYKSDPFLCTITTGPWVDSHLPWNVRGFWTVRNRRLLCSLWVKMSLGQRKYDIPRYQVLFKLMTERIMVCILLSASLFMFDFMSGFLRIFAASWRWCC